MRTIVIYDDTGRKSEVISDIIGDKGFADVVVKKRHLEEYYFDEIKKLYPNVIWKKLHSSFEYGDLVKELEIYNADDVKVMHCFSNYLISDSDKAALSFGKLSYIDETYAVLSDKRAVAGMFPSLGDYVVFCKAVMAGQRPWDLIRSFKESFEIEGLVDIGIIGNFIQHKFAF